MARVAGLMGEWATSRGFSSEERLRWRAAGYLHDSLRDARVEELRRFVEPPLEDLPAELLHGPAASGRLEREGVADAPLLLAVAYHTLGHPDLDELGRALYAADYLEPGRKNLSKVENDLRSRMTTDPESVVMEVARAKVSRMVQEGKPLRTETVDFWNQLVASRQLSPREAE
jgi:2-amino-4-hydroxy-6-hydroxymethyldihydropteridine diphosphokinase